MIGTWVLLIGMTMSAMVSALPAVAQSRPHSGGYGASGDGPVTHGNREPEAWSDGIVINQFDNRTFWSDGRSAAQFGSIVIFNDGTLATQSGGRTMFGNGRSCTQIGAQIGAMTICD